MVIVYCEYWLSHLAWLRRMPCASPESAALSSWKCTRSPTLTANSCGEPGEGTESVAPSPYSLGCPWREQDARIKANATTPANLQAWPIPPLQRITGYSR